MKRNYLIVIPLYNHGSSINGVLREVLEYCRAEQEREAPAANPFPAILVVDDGSTDQGGQAVQFLMDEMAATATPLELSHSDPSHPATPHSEPTEYTFSDQAGLLPDGTHTSLQLIRHESNRGKGVAILSAASWAAERGFTHLVTLDADGQHKAPDIATLRAESEKAPQAIIVGARDFSGSDIPGASRFGRSFSGFWMRVQTGLAVSDMQSGFRVYPVSILLGLKFAEKRFAFEMEVLVKAAWSGFEILSAPVQVYYPPPSERVSHFRKFRDNLRITLMNTKLTVRALIPLPFIKREHDGQGRISILHPLESIRKLLLRQNTPFTLGASTFAAVLINVLPLIGLQSIITLLAIGRFGLNRVWTLTVHHALWPPLVIPFCIEAGYWLRNGRLLTEFSRATIAEQATSRIFEWLLGGLVFGPLLALLSGGLVYLAARRIRRHLSLAGLNNDKEENSGNGENRENVESRENG